MNGAPTLDMTLYDYQASIFHWSQAHATDDDPGDPPTADEMDAAFLRMASAGIATVQ